ncbi:MAG: hypothetical protein ACW987_17735 [Candidatus Thorarchaeota archaeon]|jgi:hypothetical protein
MKIDKWKMVGGRVYRLAEVYDNRVFLSKTDDAHWLVYYRPKDLEVDCAPKFYSVV